MRSASLDSQLREQPSCHSWRRRIRRDVADSNMHSIEYQVTLIFITVHVGSLC